MAAQALRVGRSGNRTLRHPPLSRPLILMASVALTMAPAAAQRLRVSINDGCRF